MNCKIRSPGDVVVSSRCFHLVLAEHSIDELLATFLSSGRHSRLQQPPRSVADETFAASGARVFGSNEP